jgi:hypothetical protein
MPTTTIISIDALPGGPYNGTGTVGIVITSGVPSYFKLTGTNLDRIVSVNWYPKNLGSVEFETRKLILVDNTVGTFMIKVTDNHLYNYDRGGYISFRLDDRTVLTAPAKTYGHVSIGPLWTAPDQGLITG